MCFYCMRQDHPYQECKHLLKRDVGEAKQEKPKNYLQKEILKKPFVDLHEKKNEQTEGSHRIRQTQTLQSEGYCASATNAPSSKRDLEMMEEVTIKTKKKRDNEMEKKERRNTMDITVGPIVKAPVPYLW